MMPVLKKYSESYDKEGYYVHAPIEGLSHPIPLQTPDITAHIYRELGYESGDHVPNELTWKLYNADLHWTENTGTEQPTKEDIEEAILDREGPEFTEEQGERILSVIESYSGRFEDELYSLAEELEMSSSPDIGNNSSYAESSAEHRYFGRKFKNIDDKHFLDDLQTLENHGCIYASFQLDEDGPYLCRIEFKPKEIVKYVEAVVAIDEYRGYKQQGYSPNEAITELSNDNIKKQVKQQEKIVPASFLGAELEALVCGTKPDRYEVIPDSKIE